MELELDATFCAADGSAAPVPGSLHGTPVHLLMRVLDEIDYGLVLVDDERRARYANQLGLAELRCGDGLMLSGGIVRARRAADEAALWQALEGARKGRRRLLVAGQAGLAGAVAVVPVAAEADSCLALLVFGKRSTARALTIEFFARSHGLTTAELAVLKAVCAGSSPKDIALEQRVAVCTIRSHICSVRAKTGSPSIRDLINRVGTLPPIVPLMKNGDDWGAAMH